MSDFAKLALLLCGGVAGAASVGAAVPATPDVHASTLVVRYSAESLTTPDGVNELYRRIVLAAKRVCPIEDYRNPAGLRQTEVCRREAVARAVQSIHNSQLAALSAGRNRNG